MPGSRFDKEFANIRDQVRRVIDDTFGGSGGTVAFDMYETQTAIVIETQPLLGLKADSLDIEINEGQLVISGETAPSTDIADHQYLRRERRYGRFSRTIGIPGGVKAEETQARIKDGMLVITIPKIEETSPRVIKVTPLE